MTRQVISIKHDIRHEPDLKKRLMTEGFSLNTADYAFWRAQKDKTTITFYKSGKLLIQGMNAEFYSQQLFDATNRFEGLEHIKNLHSWIGTDESGKGDFFGPLVVAAVYIEKKDLDSLLIAELQDSKNISDRSIYRFAPLIRKELSYSVISIPPHIYNKQYNELQNLNLVLGKAHAESIESILKQVRCDVVLSDKFGDETYIDNELGKRDIKVQLLQQTKAEKNPAVAAASILAREEFLDQLSCLGKKYNVVLPKGATQNVIDAGKEFLRKHGVEKLGYVAKMNFKTTRKIIL